jgi:PAS domain S-box-containing protein
MNGIFFLVSINDYLPAGLLTGSGIFAFSCAAAIWGRMKSEEALRVAHQDAETFIGAVPSILIGVDRESRVTRWNATAEKTFQLQSAEVLGKPLRDCGIVWLRPDMGEEIESWCCEEGSRRCDRIPFEANGERRLLGMTITAVKIDGGKSTALLAIGSDVTEREGVGEALREAERNYREIFDEAIVGIFQITPDNRFMRVNPAMARIFGFGSPQQMIASVTDIRQQLYVDPVRYDEFVKVMERLGSILSLEYQVYRKDGRRIWIATSGRVVRRDRRVVRYEGMVEDVTERKLLRSQLLQAQKLESIGQLAAGIAHEINTPMQYIGDNVRFLKDGFQELTGVLAEYERLMVAVEGEGLSRAMIEEVAATVKAADVDYLKAEIPKAIEQTREGVARVSTLVGAMKEFSHPGTKEKIPVDLNHAIQNTITVARNEWKYVAEMETDFDPSVPLVPCLPGEFNQVVLNLVVNAAHAIADVVGESGAAMGKIRVQTRNYADWVEIRIQDSGTGIPEKVRALVFDPFFTTKEIGKGTGQGLAIARSLVVDKHGGTLEFETEEGKGTTFVIRLPKDGGALAGRAASA